MQKVLTVALREFKAAVMTKAFLISLVLMPILMGGSFLIQYLFRDIKSLKDKTFVIIDRTPGNVLYQALEQAISYRNRELIFDKENKEKQRQPKFILVKATPSEPTPEAKLKQRMELAEQVRNKDIYGFLDIGENVLKTPNLDGDYELAHAMTEAANISDLGKEVDKEKAKQLTDDLVTRYYSNTPTYNDFMVISREICNRIIPTIRAGKDKIDPKTLMSVMKSVPVTSKTLPRIQLS